MRTPQRLVGVLVCFVMAVSAALMGVPALDTADAYTPQSIPATATSSVAVKVTHGAGDPSDLATPKQGDTFTYNFDFTFSGMGSPDITRTTTITVNADPNAPFSGTAGTWYWSSDGGGNFSSTLPAGVSISPTIPCTSGSTCTFTVTGLGDGVLRYAREAKVASPLPDGTLIMATANAKVTPAGKATIANVSGTPLSGTCSGPYNFKQEVTDGGAWLVDMKFGDQMGNGLVALSPGNRTIVGWTSGTTATDWVRFTGPNGEDLTPTVMSNATYIANDPSAPLYVGGAAPNATWFDSLNWPYDPTTFTGTTKLPVGTQIEVQRQVTYLDCYNGVYSSSPDANRKFGIATQIAINDLPATGSGVDAFSMPGTRPPADCKVSIFVSANSGGTTTSSAFYQWTPGTETTPLFTTSVNRTDAIAASEKYSDVIFALDWNNTPTLRVYDTATGNERTDLSAIWPVTGGRAQAMAFAKNGYLFAVTAQGEVRYLTDSQVTNFMNKIPVTWNVGPKLIASGATPQTGAHDIAFDAAGNMWYSYNIFNNAGTTRIGKIPMSSLTGTGDLPVNQVAYSTQVASNVRGLAFASDGTLYLTAGLTNSPSLYTIAWNSPTVTINLDSAPNRKLTGVTGPSDLASCSFGGEPPPVPPAAKLQVQKSVIKPDGTIGAPGGTGSPATTIQPDGTIKVQYLVTVQNVGNQADNQATISDTVSVPGGFTVLGGTWALQGSTTSTSFTGGTFTIPPPNPATLDPTGATGPIARTYLITVNVKPNSPTADNWTSIGSCNTSGGGTPGTGVFNKVTIPSDDGSDGNNDACLPVEGALLKLVKKIVDANGNDVTPVSADSKYFTLVASTSGYSLSGASPTSGALAASSSVAPGTYTLGEQGNDYDPTTGKYTTSGTYEQYGSWSCTNKNDVANIAAASSVTVAMGDDITCTIKNTRKPKVHIVKTASASITDNPHIGTSIVPEADGTFTANYTITLYNTSQFPVVTEAIIDRFMVPAGLQWNGTSATVTFTGANSTASPTVASVTRAALESANGALLANSVSMPAATSSDQPATASFTIAIPLKLDLTATQNGTSTAYADNATNLGQCTTLSAGTDGNYTDASKGIPNVVALGREDLTYNSIPIEDNVACIPVQQPTTWKVEKAAATTFNADGTGATWDPNGTAVTVAADGTVTAQYRVRVTNSGSSAGTPPAVSDTLTVPAGFNFTSLVVKTTNTTVSGVTVTETVGPPKTETFTIPAGTLPTGTTSLAAGASVDYYVTVTLTAQNLGGVDWTNVGTCDTSGAGNSAKGIFNKVSLTGDTDGTDNNDACVPVQPPTKPITVEKYGMNCDTNQTSCLLPGAAFAITTDPTGTTGLTALTANTGGTSFTSGQLQTGTYYLVETKAPAGFNLLATPIKFTLGTGGVTLDSTQPNGTIVTVAGTDHLTIQVKDTKTGDLPKAGGLGSGPNMGIGLLIVLGALVLFWRTSGAETSPVRVRARKAKRGM